MAVSSPGFKSQASKPKSVDVSEKGLVAVVATDGTQHRASRRSGIIDRHKPRTELFFVVEARSAPAGVGRVGVGGLPPQESRAGVDLGSDGRGASRLRTDVELMGTPALPPTTPGSEQAWGRLTHLPRTDVGIGLEAWGRLTHLPHRHWDRSRPGDASLPPTWDLGQRPGDASCRAPTMGSDPGLGTLCCTHRRGIGQEPGDALSLPRTDIGSGRAWGRLTLPRTDVGSRRRPGDASRCRTHRRRVGARPGDACAATHRRRVKRGLGTPARCHYVGSRLRGLCGLRCHLPT